MPTVALIKGFRFYFFANEHEPIHVHVTKGQGPLPTAKIALVPEVSVIKVSGFSRSDMAKIVKLCEEAREDFIEQWKEYFE